MRILQLSTFDLNGGAPRAAYRLNSGLRRLGHESTMFVAEGNRHDPAVNVFTPRMDLISRVRRRLRRELIGWSRTGYSGCRRAGGDYFSDDRTMFDGTLLEQLPPADVINLHWITRFVDYQAFLPPASRRSPLVWTIHDMNPFTGGCHYDIGCGKYVERCGACPQLGSNTTSDPSRYGWQRKRDSFTQIARGRLHIVTPSQWMANEVKRSTLMQEFPVTVIPNGVDTDDFAPRDRSFARSTLDIQEHAKVILFVVNTDVRRKGFTLLVDALKELVDIPQLQLLSLGSGPMPIESSVPHRQLGYTRNDRLLSLVYSAADVFVVPSLQDNLPNTVLESFACGTPVVGFEIGGIPDMVRPGVTGLLAPDQDVAALGTAIVELLQDSQKGAEMAANCRRVAVQEYSLQKQAKSYEELYRAVVLTRNRAL